MTGTATEQETQALWRAMPPQRLLDGGILYSDVLRLQNATQADARWESVLTEIADEHRARARAAKAEGRLVTAMSAYKASVAAYLFAQMPLNDDLGRKGQIYQESAATMRELSSIAEARLSRIELPFAHGALVGWLVLPEGNPSGCVIVFGGQSGWGATYYGYAEELARRGLATILAEGPGQGETRMVHNVMLDVDIAQAYGSFAAYAQRHTVLANVPVGLWGNSVGGLFAALAAARYPGISAVCINGGFAAPRLLPFRTFREQAATMLGTDDPDVIQRNFDRLRFDPRQETVPGPVLVIHGGADPLVALDDQQPFLDAPGNLGRTLRIWEDGDHTIYNHSAERTAFIGDWFANELEAAKR